MSTHTAIATTSKGVVDAIQVETERPPPGHVLVKVSYSAIGPLDTYMAVQGLLIQNYPTLLGFNVSGTVTETGSGVEGLVVGDRVAGFGLQSSNSKGMQQYTILPRTTCIKIPDSLSLEEAATIPDNFVTAFYTLFDCLGLPLPTFPVSAPPQRADTPILIYGAGATSGQYTTQLLALAGYNRIIATASPKHHEYLRSLGAHHTIDYRSPDLEEEILLAAGENIDLAVDCISTEETLAKISKVMSANSSVALLLPVKEGNSFSASAGGQMWMELPPDRNPFAPTVKPIEVRTLLYETNEYMRDNLMPKILPFLLDEGIIKPNRVHLFDQGSLKERVEAALGFVHSGKVSGEKAIVKML